MSELQEHEAHPRWRSAGERECRQRLEALKGEYFRGALKVAHPCLGVQDENLAIARANIRRHDWAKRLYDGMVSLADHYADRTDACIDAMVPGLTPLHVYGTFCPVCEADNTYRMRWDHRDPERLVCFHCGAVMTDRSFPESGRLELPRSGQVLTYYIRRGFFNFDGSTAEGSGYYAYAVHNVWALPEAALGYSDPPSYRRKNRYDKLNLYDPNGHYRTVLRARALMALPDGRVPHTADAHEGHPGWPSPAYLHNTGLVRLGREFAPFVRLDEGDDFALFNRPADLKPADPPPVRDRFFPAWLLAIFNTGYARMFQENLSGTASFLMNFYKPHGHDHPDALNIAMFAEGVEVLSDLGYIGDHPLNASIRSTLKHNLVVIDEQEQLPRGVRPPGNVRLIATSPNVKLIDADCKAYDEADVYRRSCLMINRGGGPAYLVDCFRVKGGQIHDYAIHGEGTITGLPAFEDGGPVPLKRRKGVIGGDIETLRVGQTPDGPWSAAWTDEGMTMRVRFLSPAQEAIIGEGPGQRDHAEIGVRHDYLFARCSESGAGNTFVTLIEHYREMSDITGAVSLGLPEGADGPVALKITRRTGTDTVLQTPDGSDLTVGGVSLAGRAAVHTCEADGRQSLFMVEADRFSSPDLGVTLARAGIEGDIVSCDGKGFRSSISLPDIAGLSGTFVQVEDPDQGCWTAYAIKSVRGRNIAVDEFSFNTGIRFRIPSVCWVEQETAHTYRVRSTTVGELRIRISCKQAVWERDGKCIGAAETRDEDGWLIVRLEPKILRADEVILRIG